MDVGGIVLCGGQSSRMGRPKALLPFGPEVMLERVVRILSAVARPIVVVAAPDQELPPLPAADTDGNYPAVEYARASLARKLIRDRVAAGLSQGAVAKAAGVTYATISRLERGATPNATIVMSGSVI